MESIVEIVFAHVLLKLNQSLHLVVDFMDDLLTLRVPDLLTLLQSRRVKERIILSICGRCSTLCSVLISRLSRALQAVCGHSSAF